ncbi:MAG: ParB/RepB/Spo0J family partition protein [Candidatus Hydrogenedentes bacterium]|nr:ParB/RepB/Spo0J family partition protein [Candidatus Hydrogenedentota bacterium]
MADAQKKKGLGKGLGALIKNKPLDFEAPPPGQPATPQTLPDGTQLLWLDPTELKPNPKQPRQVFREEALEELSASIKRDGLQEPVIVRKVGESYELVSGERRVRACVMADIERIPAVCREIGDQELLKLGLIENIQREDLNAIELAEAYQQLIEEFKWTQEQLADEVNKKRATVTNTLRLLNLAGPVRKLVADGVLSMGHAKALLAIEEPAAQYRAARKIAEEGLSVRQAEKLASDAKPRPPRPPERKDPNVIQLEDELRRTLGTKVALRSSSPGKGKIEIEYYSHDDLERILGVLKGG